MADDIKQTLELIAPISSKALARMIKRHLISKLVINYEFDTAPASCDYLSDIGDDGKVEDCSEVPFKAFSSPFADIKLTKIAFPIEIGPKCTSLRGLFAGQKNLTSVIEIRGTSHVTCFNYLFSDCFHLVHVPTLDFSSAISTVGLYSGCHRLRKFSFIGGDKIENSSGMFAYCSSIHEAPPFHFPKCTIASSMFEGCVRLNSVPFYDFPELLDASLMYKDCLLLENVPSANMPKVTNLIRMFSNCRRLKNISSHIMSLITSHKKVLLLSAFDGCISIDENDAPIILKNRPDALLSYEDAVLSKDESKKIIEFRKKRHSFFNRHWVSNIVIFSILLLAIALASIRYWPTNSTVDDVGKPLANSNAKLLTTEEATQKAQYKDSSELLSMYSYRCDTRMTFESYLKLLEKTVVELGRYKMHLYSVSEDELEKFVVVLSNKDSFYISDVIELEGEDKKNVLLRKEDKRQLPEKIAKIAEKKDAAEYFDLLSKQQLVVNSTDFFVPEKNKSFILLHHKYQNIPVYFNDSLFFQYSNSIMLLEVDTNRLMVPMPKEGYFYYLDESGQVSDERFGNCFEINEYLYQGLQSGLTYNQAKREEAKKINSEFKRMQGDDLDLD